MRLLLLLLWRSRGVLKAQLTRKETGMMGQKGGDGIKIFRWACSPKSPPLLYRRATREYYKRRALSSGDRR